MSIAVIEGMAEGSGQPFALVLLANFHQEFQTAQMLPKDMSDSCTDMLVRGQGFVHNEDGGVSDFNSTVYLHIQWHSTEEKPVVEYVSAAWYPGLLPGFAPGWNSHGLAMTWNTLYQMPVGADRERLLSGSGSATAFVCHEVLSRAHNIDEAVQMAAPLDILIGLNFNVGDFRTKRLVTVEVAAGGIKDVFDVDKHVPMSAPVYFHANKYLRMSDTPQFPAKIVSPEHRQKAFERTRPVPASLEDVTRILGDTTDATYPIFRRNDGTQEDTEVSLVFDFRGDGLATLYRANPRLGNRAVWRRVPLAFGTGVARKVPQEEAIARVFV